MSSVSELFTYLFVDEVRQRLLHLWQGLEQSLIDDAVHQWLTLLHVCVPANGAQFEHTL